MGPVEHALRNIAPDCLAPNGDVALHRWLWTWQSASESTLGVDVMRCVSHAGANIGLNNGHAIGEAYDDGLLPELMSEAIEAAEALKL
jgi:hypothetical protein